MKIVFKVTKLENHETNVEVLFGNGDTSCGNTSLETIINSMYDLMTDEQKEKIKLISLYAGNLKFNDCPKSFSTRNKFEILVQLKDGIPNKILQVDNDRYFRLHNCADLLNEEQKDETITYKVFDVRGEIK